ncbi:MAG: hypothetical protein J6M02_01285 [Clostridia bacterium]|nr:hypothetical protein [Clostridia bacterium]
MEIGSITSSYLSRVVASYGSNAEEEKKAVTSALESEYDSYEKSSTEKVKDSSYYGDYKSMAEKILGKDLETAIHNTKRMIYGLSSVLMNPDSADTMTNYYDSASVIKQVSDNSLENLLGSVSSKEEKLEGVKVPEDAKDSSGAQDASDEEDSETETKIVTRNGVRYLETTTTYSDGRTSVETRPLDGYTGKESGVNDLIAML